MQFQSPVLRLDRHYDAAVVATMRAVAPYTMTPPARLVALQDAVAYVVAARIPGAIVECGVWRGGSMMAISRALLELGAADRELWLYDTFEGMTEPGEHDRTADGRAADTWISNERSTPTGATTGVFGASQAEVGANLARTGYPPSLLRFVQGPVEETLLVDRPQQLALVRLDTDFYESTRAELEALYPLLAPGGVLILDDYGYWLGARRAVDEYFRDNPALLLRIDGSARIIIKPAMGLSASN